MNRRTVGGIVAAVIINICLALFMYEIATPDLLGVYVCGELTAEGDRVAIPGAEGTHYMPKNHADEDALIQTAGTIAALAVFGSVIGAQSGLVAIPKKSGLTTGFWWGAGFAVFVGILLLVILQTTFMLHLVLCKTPTAASVGYWLQYTTVFLFVITSGVMLNTALRKRD